MRATAALLLSLVIALGGYGTVSPARAQVDEDLATPAVVATVPQPSATPFVTSPMAGGSTLAVGLAALPATLVAIAAAIALFIPW